MMTGISIGASKNTTGLMSGLTEDSLGGSTSNESNHTTRKSWLDGDPNAGNLNASNNNSTPGMASRLSSSYMPKKSNMALSFAASMASSAAKATAGAVVMGAKAGANAAKTAVVQRRESQSNNSNSNNSARWTSRLSWSKTSNTEETESHDAATIDSTAAASSWTQTSSNGRAMGGNSDYGVDDHLPAQSLWAQSSSKLFRRNTSPAVLQPGLDNVSHLSLYGGLLSRLPSSITFVILRRASNANSGNSLTTTSSSSETNPRLSRQKLRDLLGVRLVKSQKTNHQFQIVRDDWIDENKNDDGEEESSAQIDSVDSEEVSPLLPPQLTVLLRPGDVLESVNGMVIGGRRRSILTLGKNRCCNEEELFNVISKDQSKMEDESVGNEEATIDNTKTEEYAYFTTTLTFVCRETSAPSPKQRSSSGDPTAADGSTATSSSSTTETDITVTTTDGDTSSSTEKEVSPETFAKDAVVPPTAPTAPMVHKAYFVDQRGEAEQDLFLRDRFLTLETVQKSISETSKSSRFSIGNRANIATSHEQEEGNKAGSSLLHMGSIPEKHWLAQQTKIKEGDVLLCADDTPCYNGELAPGDLSMVWLTKVVSLSSKNYVSITTCSTPPTTMESIRKTAVAATGGALVGTGAVLMVTPLHPVGHAMAIGGLGVLGTEFETPKKAFRKAKQSAANLAARVKKQQPAQQSEATDVVENDESVSSNSGDNNNSDRPLEGYGVS